MPRHYTTHPTRTPYQKEKAWRKSPVVPTRTAVEGVVVSVSVKPWNRLRPLLNSRRYQRETDYVDIGLLFKY